MFGAITILFGVFMYKNSYNYWLIIGYIIIIALNIYHIYSLIMRIISGYLPMLNEILDNIKLKLL